MGLHEDAKLCQDPDLAKQLFKHAKTSQSRRSIKDSIELAKTEPDIPIRIGDLDCAEHLLCVENGTIDLRYGTLSLSDPNDFITKCIGLSFDPIAECPTFKLFLDQIFENDIAVIRYAQTIFGYASTGSTSDQSFFVFNGDGANGKSTILNIISAVLDPYAMHSSTDTILVKPSGSIRNDLARLAGARFVTVSESSSHSRLDTGLMKQISGSEPITARFLNQEEFTYIPQFKLFLATNHLPQLDGNDPAIWRRLQLLPFLRVFDKAEQDSNLFDKLKLEAPGILAWLVEGAVRYYAEGIKKPLVVENAIAAYRAECDPLGQFLSENYDPDPKGKVVTSILYSEYVSWNRQMGLETPSQNAFGRLLTKAGYSGEKSSGTAYRRGLKPKMMLVKGAGA